MVISGRLAKVIGISHMTLPMLSLCPFTPSELPNRAGHLFLLELLNCAELKEVRVAENTVSSGLEVRLGSSSAHPELPEIPVRPTFDDRCEWSS